MSPPWGPLGERVFDRTYSRTKDDGTKETFEEVVDRMVRGNLALVPAEHRTEDEEKELKRLIHEFKLVPAGRHWWVSGVPDRQFLFNCHRAGFTDRLADHVGFVFDELMKGGGVGANYSTEYLERQGPIRRSVRAVPFISHEHQDYDEIPLPFLSVLADGPGRCTMTYVVPDTREGWVHAATFMCDLAQQEGPDVNLVLELSRVRPRGARIKGFGGLASGPGPLWKACSDLSETLMRAVGRRLTGLEMMDVDHAIAACVVSGNVRRSARMSMMHWRDPAIFDFIDLKRFGGHWTTNISVEVDRDFFSEMVEDGSHAWDVARAISRGMLRNGEPGMYNSTFAAVGEIGDVRCSNPCGEIALEEWENCNLGHINLARVESDYELHRCATLMTRWLIRATFSDGMSWRQREVVERNRRIGVGIMGFQEWCWTRWRLTYSEAVGNDNLQFALMELYSTVSDEASAYAKELEIPRPIKTTTVAPTGTISQMVGSTAGIHPVYARHFIRRVRYADTDPAVAAAAQAGLNLEPDVESAYTTIVSYVCADPITNVVPLEHIQQVNELPLGTLFAMQQQIQRCWADNAVSFTCNLVEGAVDEGQLAGFLRRYGPNLKGTTVMVDGTYQQAPFERITAELYHSTGTGVHEASAPMCEGACPVR